MNWDDDYYRQDILPQRVIAGLCINCPEQDRVRATKQWLPNHPMCDKHYDIVAYNVHEICHRKYKTSICSLCVIPSL